MVVQSTSKMSSEEKEEEISKILTSRLCFHNDSKLKTTLESGDIPFVVMSLECPFTWKYEFLSDAHDIANRIEEKLCECEGGDADLIRWKYFILNLILCYEYARTGDLVDAIEKQSLCDKILDELTVQGSSTLMYMGIGLRHISLACKCYLLYASKMPVDAEKIYDNIVPFDKLPISDQANVHAVKSAYCSEYGYKGIKESITLIQKAIDLDDRAEWFFLLGRSLGRLRRLEKRFSVPEKRELEALKVSVQKTNNLSFMVLLAQSYREAARCVFNEHIKNRNSKSEADKMKPYCDSLCQMSKEMYMKILSKGRNDVHILIRCALGLMKLPKPWQNLHEAKDCILKALDLAPENPMANHVAGLYFNCAKSYKQAINYLCKAAVNGVFGAEIDLIIVKKKQKKSYDPLADLERLLDVYQEKPRRENILCHLGTYYYIKNDIKTAFRYWFKVLEADIHSETLKNHFENVSCNNKFLNINKVIMEEILKLLDEGQLPESDIQLYNEIINKYILYHPSIVSESTAIDVSKFSNQKFEYSSWKKEERDWKYSIIPSSKNRYEIDMKSSDNCSDRNPGSDEKDKFCDGKGGEMMAASLGDNQIKKDVACSLSLSTADISASTASTKEITLDGNSYADQIGKCVDTHSNSRLYKGNFCGQIDQVCPENQEKINTLVGDAASEQM